MKRILVMLVSIFIIIMGCSISYATEPESGESGEDGEILIQTDEEYDDLMSANSENEEIYKSYMEYLVEMYDSYERTKTVKAKVIEAGEVETEYSSDGYSMYETEIQYVTVEILEGEHKGKTIEDVVYVMTADALNNIEVSKVNNGDVIIVAVEDDGTGELTAALTTLDSAVNRFPMIAVILVIALVVIMLVTGKASVRLILPAMLVVDLVMLLIAPQILNGISCIILGFVMAVILVIVNSISINGLGKKAWVAALSSLIIVVIMFCAVLIFENLTKINGAVLETQTLAETILKRNVNFNDLYIMAILLILSMIVSTVANRVIKIMSERVKEENTIKLLRKHTNDIVMENINIIVSICMGFLVIKYLIIVGQKYHVIELMNSEIIMAEILRMVILVIGSVIVVPLTVAIGNGVGVQLETLQIPEKAEK